MVTTASRLRRIEARLGATGRGAHLRNPRRTSALPGVRREGKPWGAHRKTIRKPSDFPKKQ